MVVDSSAVMCVLLDEPHRSFVLDRTENAEIIGASSLPFEIGNALSLAFKRNRIGATQVWEGFERFSKMEIRFVDVQYMNALQLATQFSVYAYDAYVLEIALRYRKPLLTFDKGMIHVAQALNVKVVTS